MWREKKRAAAEEEAGEERARLLLAWASCLVGLFFFFAGFLFLQTTATSTRGDFNRLCSRLVVYRVLVRRSVLPALVLTLFDRTTEDRDRDVVYQP